MDERKYWDLYEKKAMDKAKASGIQIIRSRTPKRRSSRRR